MCVLSCSCLRRLPWRSPRPSRRCPASCWWARPSPAPSDSYVHQDSRDDSSKSGLWPPISVGYSVGEPFPDLALSQVPTPSSMSWPFLSCRWTSASASRPSRRSLAATSSSPRTSVPLATRTASRAMSGCSSPPPSAPSEVRGTCLLLPEAKLKSIG